LFTTPSLAPPKRDPGVMRGERVRWGHAAASFRQRLPRDATTSTTGTLRLPRHATTLLPWCLRPGTAAARGGCRGGRHCG
jgi:hypothetical protein